MRVRFDTRSDTNQRFRNGQAFSNERFNTVDLVERIHDDAADTFGHRCSKFCSAFVVSVQN